VVDALGDHRRRDERQTGEATTFHGDSTSGSVVYVDMTGVADLHGELSQRSVVGVGDPELRVVDGRRVLAAVA
jgi:hypothetical protein